MTSMTTCVRARRFLPVARTVPYVPFVPFVPFARFVRLVSFVSFVSFVPFVPFVSPVPHAFAQSGATSVSQAVTLEALLAAAFPSEIVAAPRGGRVAWVLNDRGSRNVWVGAAPDFMPRQLTSYQGDDGQDITSLAWSRDGATIVYVRGGAPNRQGEVPNPALLPQPAEQAIWAVDVSGSTPRRIGTGSNPTVSSTGQVAYLSRGQVWLAPLAGSEKAAQALTIRGTARDLRWSPDGTKLAFVSARGDHAFIGVYDATSRALRYLDPSIDIDGNPEWSPDGTRLVFTRIPATGENFMFAPRREGLPWSIRSVDVQSGRGSEVWKAEAGPGSVFQGVNAPNQLMWGAGDRIVFPWERDGWLHLYSVSVNGGGATLLTPGAFEVEHVAMSPDRRQVIYSSNQDDIDRRHIWAVPVAGGAKPIALTRGVGAEWMPAPVDDEMVAFLQSDGRRPAHVAVVSSKEANRVRTIVTGPVPAFVEHLVEPQRVTFTSTDGMEIPAQLFLPRDVRPGEKRPAVLFFHGGSRRQMLLAWHYLSYYHNTYAMNQYLATRGYVVLSVNYRSGTGYGLNFREALNYGATGASEFNDVVAAGLYMRSRPDVDPARIGIYGGSYGGYLTAHALARASDLFAVGVDIHGVHDWNVGIRTFQPNYNPPEDIARRNLQSSPLHYVKGWRSPVLLIHGDDDRNVSFAETVTLAEALRKQGVPFESLVIPDEVHGFLRYDSWLRVFTATAEFFDRYLKPQQRMQSVH
jgi:dipeptidyl aminopeptidase/acylaminoacyl peptidase